jgi:hypothetical protein
MSVVDSLGVLQRNLQPPVATLSNYIVGAYLTSRVVCAVAELGVADHLAAGARSVEELASLTQSNPDALARLLRAAASLGIFAETAKGTFKTNSMGQYLESERAGSLRAWARYIGMPWNHEVWAHFMDSLRTGKDAYTIHHGLRFFEHFEKNPEQAAMFDAGMRDLSMLSDEPVAAAYPFGKVRRVTDIGGGLGGQLAAIMARHSEVEGTLFDQASVIAGAAERWERERSDLLPRARLLAGNFFERVPVGSDVYLLKSIIHDWEDESAIRILSNCAKAMAIGGRVLVVELVIPEGNGAHFGKLLDIAMLAVTGGRERTEAEYASLFERAGLELERVVPTASPYSLVVAQARR